ncbi:MAG: hypothetical protein M9924_19295 [Rhizobiaceae bacterium]|nr:hypothetical protein [Rhizobiaceae bacterium]
MKSILNFFSAVKVNPVAEKEPFIYKSGGPVHIVMIVVIDVDPSLIGDIMATAEAKFGKTDKLVYVTDNSDFTKFRESRAAFEYLPPLVHQRLHAADMPWQAYLRERWGLLLAKWKPRLVLSYGMNIEAFLNAAPARPVQDPVA